MSDYSSKCSRKLYSYLKSKAKRVENRTIIRPDDQEVKRTAQFFENILLSIENDQWQFNIPKKMYHCCLTFKDVKQKARNKQSKGQSKDKSSNKSKQKSFSLGFFAVERIFCTDPSEVYQNLLKDTQSLAYGYQLPKSKRKRKLSSSKKKTSKPSKRNKSSSVSSIVSNTSERPQQRVITRSGRQVRKKFNKSFVYS